MNYKDKIIEEIQLQIFKPICSWSLITSYEEKYISMRK